MCELMGHKNEEIFSCAMKYMGCILQGENNLKIVDLSIFNNIF